MIHPTRMSLTLVAAALLAIGVFVLATTDAIAQLRIIIGEDGKARIEEGDDQPDAQGADARPLVTRDLSAAQALVALDAAISRAEQLNTKMDIAIVDAGGNLKLFMRMDGAWLGSIDIAIKKARTARLFDMPTGKIGQLSQPGRSLYNIEHSNGGLITFPGGVPLKAADGTVIGAIGVSGSSVENDHAVATAGANAIQ
jgi:uncharacterized protein GlcG (DUF336 family)